MERRYQTGQIQIDAFEKLMGVLKTQKKQKFISEELLKKIKIFDFLTKDIKIHELLHHFCNSKHNSTPSKMKPIIFVLNRLLKNDKFYSFKLINK